MKYYYRNWLSEVIITIPVPGEEYKHCCSGQIGWSFAGSAANTPLSGVFTTCRGRIEYQNVSVTREKLLIGLT